MQMLMEGYGVWNIAKGTEVKPDAGAGLITTDLRLGEARKHGKGIFAHVS
jgi:hypothetical protein